MRFVEKKFVNIKPSSTLSINELSKKIQTQGKKVFKFGLGQSPFPVPSILVKELQKNAHSKDYLDVSGLYELRDSIAKYHTSKNKFGYNADDVLVGPGSKELLFQCQMVFDGITLLPAPSWVSYAPQANFLGKKILWIQTTAKENWHITANLLEDICKKDKENKLLILNSPNNPSGWTMSNQEQKTILEFARKKGLWIVSDEVYARISFKNNHAPSFCEVMEKDDRVIIVNSFSKSWAMTGWRLGWITAPAKLGVQFEKLNEYNVAGPPPFIQQAGIAALKEGEAFIHESNNRYLHALSYFTEWAKAQKRIEFDPPTAAFYAFFKIRDANDSLEMAKDLLKKGVGLAPGRAFGPQFDSYLRLCFASSIPKLEKGLNRLEDWLTDFV